MARNGSVGVKEFSKWFAGKISVDEFYGRGSKFMKIMGQASRMSKKYDLGRVMLAINAAIEDGIEPESPYVALFKKGDMTYYNYVAVNRPLR